MTAAARRACPSGRKVNVDDPRSNFPRSFNRVAPAPLATPPGANVSAPRKVNIDAVRAPFTPPSPTDQDLVVMRRIDAFTPPVLPLVTASPPQSDPRSTAPTTTRSRTVEPLPKTGADAIIARAIKALVTINPTWTNEQVQEHLAAQKIDGLDDVPTLGCVKRLRSIHGFARRRGSIPRDDTALVDQIDAILTEHPTWGRTRLQRYFKALAETTGDKAPSVGRIKAALHIARPGRPARLQRSETQAFDTMIAAAHKAHPTLGAPRLQRLLAEQAAKDGTTAPSLTAVSKRLATLKAKRA